jgi:hypothetical protein
MFIVYLCFEYTGSLFLFNSGLAGITVVVAVVVVAVVAVVAVVSVVVVVLVVILACDVGKSQTLAQPARNP